MPALLRSGVGEATRLARPPRPFHKKKSATARSKARPVAAPLGATASRAREVSKTINAPVAWAHLKLAGIALWPIGEMIVSAEDAPLRYPRRR